MGMGETQDILGYCAAFCTTAAFIPQVIPEWLTRDLGAVFQSDSCCTDKPHDVSPISAFPFSDIPEFM